MADIIVKNHIYDFMRSPNIATAQQSINVPDKSELNTLKIDVEILKDNYDVINNNSSINIDNWNNTYNTVQSNSASWASGGSGSGSSTEIRSITGDHILNYNDNNKQLIYSSTTSITAFITDDINVENYSATLTQIGYGSISVKLSSTYLSGSTINTNNLDYTPTRGSSINIKRIADNQFLVSPVFFYLVP